MVAHRLWLSTDLWEVMSAEKLTDNSYAQDLDSEVFAVLRMPIPELPSQEFTLPKKDVVTRALVWFRRDLRICDNPALSHACHLVKGKAGNGVIGLYVITPKQWQRHDDASVKIDFWRRNLQQLSQSLDKLNIPLLIKTVDDFSGCAKCVSKVARQLSCTDVLVNREYEIFEKRRDAQVQTELEKKA